MDPLMSGLLNFGGVGFLAAVLLYLHLTSMKSFREELKIEREACERAWMRVLDHISKQHEITIARLDGLSKDVLRRQPE